MSIENYKKQKEAEAVRCQAMRVPDVADNLEREAAITDYNIMMGNLLDPQEDEENAQ